MAKIIIAIVNLITWMEIYEYTNIHISVEDSYLPAIMIIDAMYRVYKAFCYWRDLSEMEKIFSIAKCLEQLWYMFKFYMQGFILNLVYQIYTGLINSTI